MFSNEIQHQAAINVSRRPRGGRLKMMQIIRARKNAILNCQATAGHIRDYVTFIPSFQWVRIPIPLPLFYPRTSRTPPPFRPAVR